LQLDPASITISTSGIYLDLTISISYLDKIQFKLFQKEINKYLYIPPMSNHPISLLSNIIVQELKRYCLLYCSFKSDYLDLAQKFKTRLLNRGYSEEFLVPLFANIPSRESLLKNLLSPKKIASTKESNNLKRGPIITVDMLPNFQQPISLKSLFEIPVEITSHPRYVKSFGKNNIIIGKRLGTSIGRMFLPRANPAE
jgi:hypothetical protein